MTNSIIFTYLCLLYSSSLQNISQSIKLSYHFSYLKNTYFSSYPTFFSSYEPISKIHFIGKLFNSVIYIRYICFLIPNSKPLPFHFIIHASMKTFIVGIPVTSILLNLMDSSPDTIYSTFLWCQKELMTDFLLKYFLNLDPQTPYIPDFVPSLLSHFIFLTFLPTMDF